MERENERYGEREREKERESVQLASGGSAYIKGGLLKLYFGLSVES